MHSYSKVEKSVSAVKDRIETGLGNAKMSLELFKQMGLKDISSIRVCSFEYEDKFHVEVRWDWENGRLLVGYGWDGTLKRIYALNTDIEEAKVKIAQVILEACYMSELTASVLGD